jgi:hypothetical protein
MDSKDVLYEVPDNFIEIIDEIVYAVIKGIKEKFPDCLDDIQQRWITLVGDVSITALLTEHKQYGQIPKTTYTWRYDSGNTNTKTQDHIHVYLKGNEVFAINRNGTGHDKSKGLKMQLSTKQKYFLNTIGFAVPQNGILEFVDLEKTKKYQAYTILLD